MRILIDFQRFVLQVKRDQYISKSEAGEQASDKAKAVTKLAYLFYGRGADGRDDAEQKKWRSHQR